MIIRAKMFDSDFLFFIDYNAHILCIFLWNANQKN